MTVLTISIFESQFMQMPGPRDIVISCIFVISCILCCAKALGLGTHFGEKAPGCPGGGGKVTGQIDTCINNTEFSQ